MFKKFISYISEGAMKSQKMKVPIKVFWLVGFVFAIAILLIFVLEKSSSHWSAGTFWFLTCAVILGPYGGLIVAFMSALGFGIRLKLPIIKNLFNFSMFTILNLSGWWIFTVVHVSSNTGVLLGAAMAASVTYLVINIVLLSGVIKITNPKEKFFKHLFSGIKESSFNIGLGFIVMGGWVLYSYLSILGLVVILVPTLGVQFFVLMMGRRIVAEQKRIREEMEVRATLTRKALDASNVERSKIASELHDTVVQDLSVLVARLRTRAEKGGEEAVTLTRAADTAEESIDQLRGLIKEIAPKDLSESGLQLALMELGYEILNGETKLCVKVEEDCERIPGGRMVYRVAQEALRNIAKHAQAKTATIRVQRMGERIHLEVEDNGRGFAQSIRESKREEGHMGMTLIQTLVENDGGDLSVRSQLGFGTLVLANLPIG